MKKPGETGAEEKRLREHELKRADWMLWGPYVSERAWGTVREDYSPDGSAWDYFPFEHAHLRAFRWSEDGIAGICDDDQFLCFAISLWNEKDEILKERLFGLAGPKGNHGEDVKEYYYYLDNTPTHSYMKFLYKYPQSAFPYRDLYDKNAARGKSQAEYELIDTGIFDEDKYFDVLIEYAKAGESDICIRITASNRGDAEARLHLLPTIWFRNIWSWSDGVAKPTMQESDAAIKGLCSIETVQTDREPMRLIGESGTEILFVENETNFEKLNMGRNASAFTKDGIGEYVVHGKGTAVNTASTGTKAAIHYEWSIPAEGQKVAYLRLAGAAGPKRRKLNERQSFIADCRSVFDTRIAEADEFYAGVIPEILSADAKNVMRQSLAGMLWSKQFYHYVIKQWLEGDPSCPHPIENRAFGRNAEWKHLYNEDIISMPDKWEYPWYAAWDLAFHCIPLALLDPLFAKRQLILLLREWYMHPSGQLPAYEWAFNDVNPPVHAWAALRVYQIEKKKKGVGDRVFLERVFHKLLLNFTWWVNRKDDEGNNVFEGGFLGLDNIGVFDRSHELPTGGHLEQSDGTSWMAMFCLNMLAIALELAGEDGAYEDVATKFFEHFVYISDAMNNLGNQRTELWNERDGFYYDALHLEGSQFPIKLRSLVGLIPLFAVETIEAELLERLPDFRRRTEWFLTNRADLTRDIECTQQPGVDNRRLLALVNRDRLRRVLERMLSEKEFLSDFGIRSLSRIHRSRPYFLLVKGVEHRVAYEPGESRSGMFGGNSNWRGPVWFPVNYLLIEALQKFDHYFGDDFTVEFPTGSGKKMNLWQVSQELEKRLCALFLRDDKGMRASLGGSRKQRSDPHWADLMLFHEYFHGDNGSGLGAIHQTGWTGLIAKILKQVGEHVPNARPPESAGKTAVRR